MTMIVLPKLIKNNSSGFLIYRFSRKCSEHTSKGGVNFFAFSVTIDLIMTDLSYAHPKGGPREQKTGIFYNNWG